jgi:hypothetical protein
VGKRTLDGAACPPKMFRAVPHDQELRTNTDSRSAGRTPQRSRGTLAKKSTRRTRLRPNFGAEMNRPQAIGDPGQHESLQEPRVHQGRDKGRRPRRDSASKNWAEHPVLELVDDRLSDASRPVTPALNGGQIAHADASRVQRTRKNVGSGSCILYGVVDAVAVDRRHHMRRIADQ